METVLVPGGRDVRGTVTEPAEPADTMVVCSPPHPQQGGSRTDRRLVAVSEALTDRGIAAVRIDYGPWDGGVGEREDVRNAIRWAADRNQRVGVFGYSFGASQALLAAASVDRELLGVAALAPAPRLGTDLDVVDAVADIEAPGLILHGERDATVDTAPVVEAAREVGWERRQFPADHFFLGQEEAVATAVGEFFGGLV